MATRGWARSIVMAVLVAAGVGAAQLGLGYGLGIMAWVSPSGAGTLVTSQGTWVASLAWTVWVASTSVVAGAVCADRLGRHVESGRWGVLLWRVVIALAAAVGALITVPLVAVPARAAQLTTTFAPHLLAGIYAMAGVLIGLVAAVGAVASRAITINIIATAGWLYTLAVIAVADGVAAGRGLGFAQLAVWRFTEGGDTWRNFYVPGALLMLGGALIIGALAAWAASLRRDNRVGIAIAGAFGPLLVAGAYFLAAPELNVAPAEQYSAYLTAPYTVIAGLAGSVLVAAIGVQDPAGRAGPMSPVPASAPASPAPAPSVPAKAPPAAPAAPVATAKGSASVPPPAVVTATASVPAANKAAPGEAPPEAKTDAGTPAEADAPTDPAARKKRR